ncbi:MAG: DUF1572 family protein [Chitinophagaceae bacterium]
MKTEPSSIFIESIQKRFLSYQLLGEKTLQTLEYGQLIWQAEENSNSIAIIIQHLSGNMKSRFSDFLHADGEKDWRNRDEEFMASNLSHGELLELWEKGWTCLFDALQELKEEDLTKTIYIRKEPLTVIDALLRQLSHYAYHVGQIVFIAKMLKGNKWESLSIPKSTPKGFQK